MAELCRCWKRTWMWMSLALLAAMGAQAGEIVRYGDTWKYVLGTQEASAPVAAWRAPGFSDSAWLAGAAPIGYSTSPNNPAEESIVTVLPHSSEAGYLSVFMRKAFTVANPAAYTDLTLNVSCDDGFIAWINGVEVARFNVPDGDPTFDFPTLNAIEPALNQYLITQNLSQTLRTGQNVLAIQLFNANFGSSDLVLDAALSSNVDDQGPAVADIDPPAQSVVPELTTVEVIFSESVRNVKAGDLLVNGAPAAGFTEVSPIDYTFSFPQPPQGLVTFSWAPGQGITDRSPSQNRFVPTAGWTLTLNTNLPPPTVMITEFMADNENGVRDNDGNRSDWIELYNASSDSVSLNGWFLTDTTNNLTRWRLPAVRLDGRRYLLIWASGNNRADPSQPLHTNFRLSKDGSYLALVSPSTNIVSEFRPAYPAQRPDISYGRDLADPSITGFLSAPTPGAANASRGAGFAPEPVFSREQGVFTNSSISVTLTAPSGQIRYTIDGSVPTTNSTPYTTPISVSTSTTVKARVFQNGVLPSAVIAQNYMMLDRSVTNFTSNLPLMIFSTSGRPVADHVPQGSPRTFASLLAIDTFRGRSSFFAPPNYFGQSEMGIRGQTSAGFPKRPYRVELQDANRIDYSFGLFGMPPDGDWILMNPYSDKPLIQNFLAQELFEKMGHYAVRRRFVEVFVNSSGGKISYPRDYMGVYLLVEKIEAGNDRVDIERLNPEDSTEPAISGGYMFKKDKDSAGDRNFSTSGGNGFSGQGLKIHEPKPYDITTAQLNWIRNYLNQFERALYSANWRTATGTNHYSHYIDVDSFVDQHWIVEFSKQIDGYRLSNYMSKDRNGKVKMEPIWDWNLSFGNADYLDGYNPQGWYYSLIGENEHIWLRRLMSGTTSPGGTSGDPDFNQKIADRWSVLRTNVLNGTVVTARVDELAAMLAEAAERDFQKWPRLGVYVWPNPGMYSTPTTYAGVIAAMKNWIRDRYNWIDSQFIRPPVLSHAGGRVPPGTRVSITAPAGTIFYTTDGSDPRLPGGNLSPKAVQYTASFTLDDNAGVVARSRQGARWSGPASASFVMRTTRLLISELMYHPADPPTGSSFLQDDYEFIEFKNAGTNALSLAGYRITDGVDFVFPDYNLGPGQRVLVVKNRAGFESRYGAGLPIAGEYTGVLNNAGERIAVLSALGELVMDFTYAPEDHPQADGPGFSLVLASEDVFPEALREARAWRYSARLHGSPGLPEQVSGSFPRVVVNEVLSRPAAGGKDTVELRNLSAAPAAIGGWFLTDDSDTPRKFRIPDGTVAPPHGFLTFNADQFDLQAQVPFGLGADGDGFYLFSSDGGTNVTGYMHGFEFGPQAEGVSFGRHVDSTGREHFVAQSATSFGASNAPPRVPPVVISEIMFHPPDVVVNGIPWNNGEDEYIELHNRADQTAALFRVGAPAEVWTLAGTVSYTFPANTSIPPRGWLLLVSFNPVANPAQAEAFRSKYNVPAEVPILGPYLGQLDNRGNILSLFFPDQQSGAALPPILAEEIAYGDDYPWPAGADGLGYALSRVSAQEFGNDPAHWQAARPTPGAAFTPGGAPVITRHPASATLAASMPLTLSVAAEGPGSLRYQWRRDGDNLPGATNSLLSFLSVQPAQSGRYSVVVMNAAGSASSAPATVLIDTDSDGDGLLDSWEIAFGMDLFNAADADWDVDGDLMTSRQEFLAGTNPHDWHSALRVLPVSVAGQTTVSFEARPNRTYTVQFTDALGGGAWTSLGSVGPRPESFTASLADTSSAAGSRYYRVVTPAVP